MIHMKTKSISGLLFILSLLLTCCTPSPTPGLANPASAFCQEQGGELEIRTTDDGGQVGYCLFDDGSECEEWTLFRGECAPGEFEGSTNVANPASAFCQEQGGELEIRTADDGGQAGYCLFPDGSECEEWAFFRGECAPGESQ